MSGILGPNGLGASLVVAGLAAALPASAALAPNYQRAAELAAAIRVAAAAMPRDPIDGVEHLGDDRIRIRAGKCRLLVEIVDLPRSGTPLVGPRRFSARAGKPDCD